MLFFFNFNRKIKEKKIRKRVRKMKDATMLFKSLTIDKKKRGKG